MTYNESQTKRDEYGREVATDGNAMPVIGGTMYGSLDIQGGLGVSGPTSISGMLLTGRVDLPSTSYTITNPVMRFTQIDSSSTDDHAKGLLLEWGGNMSTGVNYPYGIATNAYIANPSATFTVPTTGYKKWGWIMTHYQSPASTGETVHQHLNFETVKADFLTVITRLQISFGEDIALVSFPNSHVKVFNDKNLQVGTDTAGTFIKHDTALARITVSGSTWRWASTAEYVSVAPGGIMLFGGVTGESVNRFSMNTSGRMDWGSGSATRDTNLYRNTANELKTDDKFTAALGVNVGIGAAVPATFSSTGITGDIAYDASFIYICTATDTWKRAAIATW